MQPKQNKQTNHTTDILWNQYQTFIDFYKFNTESVIKLNTLHYAISGAIFSFYFTHANIELSKFALFLPFIFSLGLSILFWGARPNIEISREEIVEIAEALGLKRYPEFRILKKLLTLFVTLNIIISVACVFAFFANKTPSPALVPSHSHTNEQRVNEQRVRSLLDSSQDEKDGGESNPPAFATSSGGQYM
jgi:hypothetical protein